MALDAGTGRQLFDMGHRPGARKNKEPFASMNGRAEWMKGGPLHLGDYKKFSIGRITAIDRPCGLLATRSRRAIGKMARWTCMHGLSGVPADAGEMICLFPAAAR